MRISQTGEVNARMKVWNGSAWVELQTVSSGAPDLGIAVGRPFDVEPYDDSAFSQSFLALGNPGTQVKLQLTLPVVSAVDLIVERITFCAPSATAIVIVIGAVAEGGDVVIGPFAARSTRRIGSTVVPIGVVSRNPATLLGPPAVNEIFRTCVQQATTRAIELDVPHQIDVPLEGIAVYAGSPGPAQDLAVSFYWREEP